MEDTFQVVVEVDLTLMELLALVVLVVVEQEIKVVLEQQDQQTLVVAVVDLVADLTLEEQVVLELL
jgi:hypothetical protein